MDEVELLFDTDDPRPYKCYPESIIIAARIVTLDCVTRKRE